MRKTVLSLAGALVLGVAVVLLNGISGNLFSRWYVDLTEEGLYSLSPGTKSLLHSMSEPITLRLYISRTEGSRFPAIKLYGDRVVDLLREYERNANGKLAVEIYDPRPDSDEESWAQKYGLTPLAMPSGEQLFFGLAAVNASGAEDVIPVFNVARQEFLEYDITKLIYSLGSDSKPGIGIISSLDLEGTADKGMPMFGARPPQSEPWVLLSQINNLGTVQMLPPTSASIPPNVKVLLLVHPKGLSPSLLYAVDQFVMRGGNLFVAVDPYCNVETPSPSSGPSAAMFAERSSDLKELLGKWGVELVPHKAVGDINLASQVRTSEMSPPEDFVLWLSLRNDVEAAKEPVINKSSVLTGQLDSLLLPWAGALKVTPTNGIQVETLLETTPEAQLFEEMDYRIGGGKPDALLQKYTPGNEAQKLAVRLTGKFPSNYTEAPKSDDGTAPRPPHLATGEKEATVVVVSDVDFLADFSSVQVTKILGTRIVSPLNDNLVFAANLTESLLGSSDLIGLRSRGQFTRPFNKINELERSAQEKWRAEEARLVAELNAANERLNQLQQATGGTDNEKMLSGAVFEEMRKFRAQRSQAQQKLREVRRELRQDIERLETRLFILNTFLVPVLLVLGAVFWSPRRRAASRERKEEVQAAA